MSHERPLVDAQNPWPGLDKYREEEAAFFFGREEEVNELVRLLALENLLVLYGRSGVGKSSLLSAGLFPKLRPRHLLPVYVRLDFAPAPTVCGLSSQVLDRLLEELNEHQIEHPRPRPDEPIWAYLHRRDRELWSRDNHLVTPVLVFDQFEECFTLGEKAPERVEELRHLLADLIEGRAPESIAGSDQAESLDLQRHDYKVLLSLREDYLPDLEIWRDQVPSLLRTRLRLQPLSPEVAEKAVARAGLTVVEPEAVSKIVSFVANKEAQGGRPTRAPRVEPVLLSLFCTQLNRRRDPEGRIDVNLVKEQKENILRDFYREAFKGMPNSVAYFIEDHLVVGDRFRVRYPQEQLLADGALTLSQLEALTRRRLLRVDSSRSDHRVELIHDRLVSVVVESRDRRARREAEEKARKARWIAVAMASLALASLVASFWAVLATGKTQETLEQAAKRAHGRAWEVWDKPEHRSAYLAESLLYFEHPYALEDAALALRQIVSSPLLAQVRHDQAVDSATFSPDGRVLATRSRDQSARLWSASSGEAIAALRHKSDVLTTQFSPDGTHLMTTSEDGSVHIWSAFSAKPVAILRGHSGPVVSAAFSPDGTLVVTASKDSTAKIWNVDETVTRANGHWATKEIALLQHEKGLRSAEFSPNGKQVVTAGEDGKAKIWDARTGRLRADFLRHPGSVVVEASFSPDGTQVLTAGLDAFAKIWDIKNEGRPKSLLHKDSLRSAVFSPDGTQVVTNSKDGAAWVWDARTGDAVFMLHKVSKALSAVFSPDGIWVATTCEDGSLRVWDSRTGELSFLLARLEGPLRGFYSANFSPDGTRLVIAGTSGVYGFASVWDTRARNAMPDPAGAEVSESNLDRSMVDRSLLVDALHVISGHRIRDDGRLAILKPQELLEGRQRLLEAAPVGSDLGHLVRWHLSGRGTRHISPSSEVSVPDYIEREIGRALENPRLNAIYGTTSKQTLYDAYALDPGHPLILLALSVFEVRPETKKLWKDLSMPRIEGDARIAARAAEILQQDNDPDYAARAARIALDLEPDDEIAQTAQAVLDWATVELAQP